MRAENKHTYNQAFAVYALSEYYKASGKKEALNLAYNLYHVMESKCRDSKGYFEAFSRDFFPFPMKNCLKTVSLQREP